MNHEAVDQLIALFKYVAYNTQENQLKLAALERAISHHQELNTQHQEWVGKLRFVPPARADRQKIEEAIELLRQALLRDSEHCEIPRGGPGTVAHKAMPGDARRK